MKNVLGIFRAACYSPGMVERDEAILRTVARHLEGEGYEVSLIHEEELASTTPLPDIVIHMARSARALDILQAWQEAGCRVINTVKSVQAVERAALARLCATRGIPTPKTWIVPTSTPWHDEVALPCWIKRAGACAQEPDDVCRVTSRVKYEEAIARLRARGIHEAVVMQHLEGPCIKFYAVKGTDFFHCLPAYDKWSDTISPARREEHNAYAMTLCRSLLPLIEMTNETPTIYGGDAIIADDTAYLIDLNDWPSFSACREDAAKAIALLVEQQGR